MPPGGPTDDEVLAAAGAPGHGRVLARGVLDRVAVAVADVNGDGAMYEAVTLQRDDDGSWGETSWGGAGLLAQGWTGGVAYAYGVAPDTEFVVVGFRDEVRTVPVDQNGWWLVLAAADEGETFDLQLVPDPLPRSPGHRPDRGPPRIAG